MSFIKAYLDGEVTYELLHAWTGGNPIIDAKFRIIRARYFTIALLSLVVLLGALHARDAGNAVMWIIVLSALSVLIFTFAVCMMTLVSIRGHDKKFLKAVRDLRERLRLSLGQVNMSVAALKARGQVIDALVSAYRNPERKHGFAYYVDLAKNRYELFLKFGLVDSDWELYERKGKENAGLTRTEEAA